MKWFKRLLSRLRSKKKQDSSIYPMF